jgi:anti-sigma B factor antagonist
VMAAMAGYSLHTDDIALLMLRRTPGEPAGSGPDSSQPAGTGTALERGVLWSGRHAVVTMPTEMDITNASGVSDLLAAVAAESPEVITADMTATLFCDSSGVSALARAHELAATSGSELRLALGDSPAARIIQLIGLDQIVPVYRDVQESLATPTTGLTAGLLLQHQHIPFVALADQRRGIGTDLLSAMLARMSASSVSVAHAGSGGTDHVWPGVPLNLCGGQALLCCPRPACRP